MLREVRAVWENRREQLRKQIAGAGCRSSRIISSWRCSSWRRWNDAGGRRKLAAAARNEQILRGEFAATGGAGAKHA